MLSKKNYMQDVTILFQSIYIRKTHLYLKYRIIYTHKNNPSDASRVSKLLHSSIVTTSTTTLLLRGMPDWTETSYSNYRQCTDLVVLTCKKRRHTIHLSLQDSTTRHLRLRYLLCIIQTQRPQILRHI